MIKIIIKNLGIVFICFFIITAIYVIYIQTAKLKSYEGGNGKAIYNKVDLLLQYNKPNINIEDENNDELNKFITCYQSPIDKENFNSELNNKYNKIEDLFKNAGTSVSFSYEDLYSGLHISFNENQTYFSASVIKAPVVIYILNLYADNKVNLDEVLTYQQHHYVQGSGLIQYEPFGSKYTIKQLIEKAIIDSDNVAYQMLASRFNSPDIKNYWKNLTASTFWTNNSIWGQVNSKDGVIYMKQLYNFTKSHKNLENDIINLYLKSVCRLINLNNKDIKIAHKSGWNSANIHDMAIIYDAQPYVLSINTLLGYGDYTNFFNKASNLINEFHQEYWNQKMNYCYSNSFS